MSREPDLSQEKARARADAAADKLIDVELKVEYRDELVWATVPRDHALEYLTALRDEGFDYLVDVTAHDTLRLDELGPERFCVHWLVHSYAQDCMIHVRSWVPEADPRVDTVTGLWKSALWGERECYDMYGIEFEGHPDLRRILMPEDYGSFPLRKDYPLKGKGERDSFPVITRDKA